LFSIFVDLFIFLIHHTPQNHLFSSRSRSLSHFILKFEIVIDTGNHWLKSILFSKRLERIQIWLSSILWLSQLYCVSVCICVFGIYCSRHCVCAFIRSSTNLFRSRVQSVLRVRFYSIYSFIQQSSLVRSLYPPTSTHQHTNTHIHKHTKVDLSF